jgi:hypothetical protein
MREGIRADDTTGGEGGANIDGYVQWQPSVVGPARSSAALPCHRRMLTVPHSRR